MKMIFCLVTALSLSGLASAKAMRKPANAYTVHGKEAQKLFNQMQKAQPKGKEMNCLAERCFALGTVRCETSVETGHQTDSVQCHIIPLSE